VTEIEPTIIAPVSKNAVMGTVKIMLDTEELASRPLVALDEVEEGSIIDRLKDEVRLLFQ
jgi:serine-type D-Ala-D-Ala carboxypeptidase (penicillin-binding protein 5/6)